MDTAVITALISAGATLIVCMINNNAQVKKIAAQHDKTIGLIDYKLTELSERVDKHNSVIERTYQLEKLTELQEEKLKVANHRIDDLEKGGK